MRSTVARAIRVGLPARPMKLEVRVAASEFLASVSEDHQTRVMAVLRGELNERIDEADRRLSCPGSSRALRRARDHARRSAMCGEVLVLRLETRGLRITIAGVELSGLSDLEAALGRDAVRTFARRVRMTDHASAPENRAALSGAEEGTTR